MGHIPSGAYISLEASIFLLCCQIGDILVPIFGNTGTVSSRLRRHITFRTAREWMCSVSCSPYLYTTPKNILQCIPQYVHGDPWFPLSFIPIDHNSTLLGLKSPIFQACTEYKRSAHVCVVVYISRLGGDMFLLSGDFTNDPCSSGSFLRRSGLSF